MRPALVLALLAAVWSGAAPASVPPPARDQAYVVPLPVAKAALAVLSRHGLVVWYCEPCGDAAPSASSVHSIEVRPWDDDPSLWVVWVNGQGVDLAYTYVPVGDEGQAVNLALVAGMADLQGVSPVITFDG